MMKKSILLFLLIWCVTVQAEMVDRYSFDDGDTTAVDSIGGKDGILTNTATILAGKLVLDGSSAVNLPSDTLDTGLTSVTIEVWCQLGASNTWARLFDFGGSSGADGGNTFYLVPNNNTGASQLCISTTGYPSWSTGENNIYGTGLAVGAYTHLACVFDGSVPETRLYINGQLAASAATTMDLAGVARQNAFIGDSSYSGDPYFNGSVDEFRIYDTALNDEEVLASFNAGADASFIPGLYAKKPNPKNGATDISIDVGKIFWTPAPQALKENVFWGTDPNVVESATIENPMGATVYEGLDVNSIDLDRLAYGTTYYWRVDEVNDSPGQEIYTGKVWSFTTEPEGIVLSSDHVVDAITSMESIYGDEQEPNSTYNGNGLDANDMHSTVKETMWLGLGDAPGDVWIQYELDQIYQLHELIVWNYNEESPNPTYGAKDVNVTYSTDNETWKALDNIVVFNEATGLNTYKANTFVDMNNAVAKYIRLTFLSSRDDTLYTGGLSEIKFSVIPTRATVPSPEDKAKDVALDSIMSWKAGRNVGVHKIYISSDKDSLTEETADIVATTEEPNYIPALDLTKTYYWRVDEVNDAEAYPVWDGPVWSFTIQNYAVVDGFESGYGNTEANAVYKTWKDGVEQKNTSVNGSVMGRSSPPYLQTINHTGGHSAPMKYRNGSASYSEVTADTSKLAIGSDWTKGNPDTLEIWFRADANDVNESVTDQLYVILNSTKVAYDGPAANIRKAAWTKWEVPLDGIDHSNITSITIGAEKIAATGGTGIIYLDDIRLTIPAKPMDPGTDNLIAYYAMENNLDDNSGNGIMGTYSGDAATVFVDGPLGNGKALEFNPDTNDVVDLGSPDPFNFAGSFTIAYWANIQDWSTEWSHVMTATYGEGMGFAIRRGGAWVAGMQGKSGTALAFTTRGISLEGVGTSEDMITAEPAQKTWTHIVCVYDHENNLKSVYFDGDLIQSSETVAGATLTPSTANATIGARSNGTIYQNHFKGMLDEVRFYDKALTAEEVKFIADPNP
jgi:hypothetical protein